MAVPDLADSRSSRAATDALLGLLKEGRWHPAAIARFLGLAVDRSVRQAARRPQALAQTTAQHALLFIPARGRPGRRWVAASWALTALHLGLLEERIRLSPADVLTLIRGNLPATALGPGRWSGALVIASDLADGRLARHQDTVSAFGEHADSLADAAFWTWLVLRNEPSRTVRAAAIAAWAAPAVTVTGIAIIRGRIPELPRPALIRPAAAMQGIVALRQLLRSRRPPDGIPYSATAR
ncbi:CDP-alcohol phosphatidyltransferase family protein [Streptomyces sp. TBY4]|uniref:CDP-alcohol phosphatidyltransferase family protein n=1 Tax=Streptomyces sp. TBY4 TaxID=2962030 RepID=UPI0020B6B8AE|nr:CDP-alcohol phosphatidyltransferase family protein [Streptomyces sp. TBY4]MCP3757253.1 CDP-alcohol phosphatidyltransferase family protein [Streptomyces sp. TBY4]